MAGRPDTSYATKVSNDPRSINPIGCKPVFVKHNDIPSINEKVLTNEDMYKCLVGHVQGREIKGVQKIGGLWRLYIESHNSRIKLITNGTNMRNANIAVHDTNPFLSTGKENSICVLIKDIPLSAHDTLIIDELVRMKCKVTGSVIYQRLRIDGNLTDCFTGDRVVYIEQPQKPLPRLMNFGIYKGKVFHFSQIAPVSRSNSTVVCSKCQIEGHHRSQCSNPVVCRQCKQPGHLQIQCTLETPPTSHIEASAATTTSTSQALDQLISLVRHATTSSSSHPNDQTQLSSQAFG